jgi:hypothetical protein
MVPLILGIETLQKQVREAPEQDDHEDDPNID